VGDAKSFRPRSKKKYLSMNSIYYGLFSRSLLRFLKKKLFASLDLIKLFTKQKNQNKNTKNKTINKIKEGHAAFFNTNNL
jgi:ribosome-interacting GTPase 1